MSEATAQLILEQLKQQNKLLQSLFASQPEKVTRKPNAKQKKYNDAKAAVINEFPDIQYFLNN